VIEIRGGVLQTVYMDKPENFQIVVVDWDDIFEGGKPEVSSASSLDDLNTQTATAAFAAISNKKD
jgi:hypothetical protein